MDLSVSDHQIFSLPKVELHAHLSGSLSDYCLEKLIRKKHDSFSEKEVLSLQSTLKLGEERSLEECFKVFKAIHILTSDVETVKMMCFDVIKEFNEDNVWYLEIRTTPKSVPGVYTKQDYLEAVLESIREAEKEMKIVVRLLVSIDRGRGVNDAWDTLNLTKKFLRREPYRNYICGIDVSGKPDAGSLQEYVPILREAKTAGLKLAVHLLEVNTPTAFEEATEILNEQLVDRIGHGTFLHPVSGGSKDLTNVVKENKVPIELCLTSNVKGGCVESLEKHHVNIWNEENHPIAICTDDKGIFSTTLTKELALYRQVTGQGLEAVKSIITNSLDASFLGTELKEKLMKELSCSFKGLN